MSLKFGISLPQGWTMDLASIDDPIEAYEAMTHVARTAEGVGFESAWLVDHFHTIPHPSQEVTFESWTTTAALARDTQRIRIGQMVTCNGYRNPALLAKMASTVDVLAHGRLNFGIGAGWFEDEFRAYGFDFPDTAERLARLREAVQVILAMWTQEEARFDGAYYQLRGAINQPKGVQRPHIPLLIGGGGEQVTLKLVAQFADACNIGGNLATLRRKFEVLRRHCEQVGRDYRSIRRTVTGFCSIGTTDEQARAKIPAPMLERMESGGRLYALIGGPATIRSRLRDLEALGVDELIIGFPDVLQDDTLRFFADECIHTAN